jgi:hypothetical protein
MYSQIPIIPNLNYNNSGDSINSVIKLLKLEDKNSLVVKINRTPNTVSYESKYIVYQNDGKILKFKTIYKNIDNVTIKKIKVKKNTYRKYWDFLNANYSKINDLDVDSLNITTKPIDSKNISKLIVFHESSKVLEFIRGSESIYFGSENAETFIKEKFPGYLMREKFMNVYNGFTKLYKENNLKQ